MRRRNALKYIGAATLLGTSATASVSGNKNDASNSAEDQLYGQVRRAIKREESTKAVERVMENHNREYKHLSTNATIDEFDYTDDDLEEVDDLLESDDSEINPEDRYSESSSELDVLVYEHGNDNTVAVFTQMTLSGVVPRLRSCTDVDDAIGISFNDDHWSVVGTPNVYVESPNDAGFYSQSLQDGGLAGEIDLVETPLVGGDVYVELYSALENLDGVAGTIFGSYAHTTASAIGSIDSITGGPQGITVSLSPSTSTNVAWDPAEPVDPAGLF